MNALQYKGFNLLIWMLGIKRKYNSVGDVRLCKAIATIPGMEVDLFGNHMLRIGDNGNPMTITESKKNQAAVLFSAHTDTVHNELTGPQQIYDDTTKKEFFIKSEKGCLGADDGAGVWLLIELIKAKTPGLYIFHRGEECGGLGSTHIADNTPDLIEGIKVAVAFDRRGKTDIINRQSCGKCCSDEFVTSLANQLKLGHTKATGSFTDTSNYAGIIPECTNVSVGYEHEHTPQETLHYGYLKMLCDSVLKVDWTKLTIKREVTDFGPVISYGNYRIQSYITLADAKRLIEQKPKIAAQLMASAFITEDDVKRALKTAVFKEHHMSRHGRSRLF